MKKAIVSGASSGIGKEISKKLLQYGYKVFGIGRYFSKCDIKDKNFHPLVCNLKDKKELHNFLQKHKKEDISILVNCAGFGKFAPHEEISVSNIEDIIQVNLTVPLLLAKTFLRTLKRNKGHILMSLILELQTIL